MMIDVNGVQVDLPLDFAFATIEELRRADPAVRAFMETNHPLMVSRPLGLCGEYPVGATVLDADVDYYLDPFWLAIEPAMTAWDIARTTAHLWTRFSVMDSFAVAHLYLEENGSLGIALYAEPGRVLTDEEVELLP
jgi:hypothetical protein